MERVMREAWIPLLVTGTLAGMIVAAAAQAQSNSSVGASVSNPGNCKVVERKAGDPPAGTVTSGSMSSSVTAGGGKTSAHTTGGGQSVTVQSGDGRASSSVTTSGSPGSSSVVVGSGTGDCTIYIDKK
jgi:hypothetical protein